jgi:uncharacterized damage-inducible protein DinB
MSAHFRELFLYDEWANREVICELRKLESPSARAIELLAHILSAQHLWLERLGKQPQSYPVWPNWDLAECEKQVATLSDLWGQYVQESPKEAASYKNTAGESWRSEAEDVLMHVIMHSAYHRGQIAIVVRQAGFTPAYTDYIHGVRKGFVPGVAAGG